jgi:preprotein translocase subunit YajC
MGNSFSLLFPLIIVLLFVPIFLSGRKQKRQAQEMKQLQHDITDGDVVWTTCGLRGKVVDTNYEDTIDLEIADGVVTTWLRQAVREKVDPNADAAESSTADTAAPSGDGHATSDPTGVTENDTDIRPGTANEAPSTSGERGRA